MTSNLNSVNLPSMENWIVQKSLRSSKSNELDKLDNKNKQIQRSMSARHNVTVAKGLLVIKQRHNSVTNPRIKSYLENYKPRPAARSYFNSPVKRTISFQQKPQITLQGKFTRSNRTV